MAIIIFRHSVPSSTLVLDDADNAYCLKTHEVNAENDVIGECQNCWQKRQIDLLLPCHGATFLYCIKLGLSVSEFVAVPVVEHYDGNTAYWRIVWSVPARAFSVEWKKR